MKLTKHCYELHAVLETLGVAIQSNDFRAIQFWVHECIESGFARECWEWLLHQPPQKYIGRDEKDWQPAFCYTLALRLARPTSKILVVTEHETAHAMFPEPDMTDISPRHYLALWYEAHPYPIHTSKPIPITAVGNWTELCVNTPYWRKVFETYGVDATTALEDEAFTETFNYELDEQPETLYKLFGYSNMN